MGKDEGSEDTSMLHDSRDLLLCHCSGNDVEEPTRRISEMAETIAETSPLSGIECRLAQRCMELGSVTLKDMMPFAVQSSSASAPGTLKLPSETLVSTALQQLVAEPWNKV